MCSCLPHCASNNPRSSGQGSSPNRVNAQNIIVSSYGLNPTDADDML